MGRYLRNDIVISYDSLLIRDSLPVFISKMSSFVKDVFSGFRILSLWFICLFPQCFKNVAFPSCFIVSSEKFTAILIFLCNIFLWMLLIFYFITCFEKFDFGILWCDLLIFLLLDVHKTSWILLGFIVFIKFGGFQSLFFHMYCLSPILSAIHQGLQLQVYYT